MENGWRCIIIEVLPLIKIILISEASMSRDVKIIKHLIPLKDDIYITAHYVLCIGLNVAYLEC